MQFRFSPLRCCLRSVALTSRCLLELLIMYPGKIGLKTRKQAQLLWLFFQTSAFPRMKSITCDDAFYDCSIALNLSQFFFYSLSPKRDKGKRFRVPFSRCPKQPTWCVLQVLTEHRKLKLIGIVATSYRHDGVCWRNLLKVQDQSFMLFLGCQETDLPC